jgi:hypothetical protein
MSKPKMVGTIDDLTPSDRFIIQSGAILSPGCTLTLPSGREITAKQWAEFGGRNA